MMSKRRNFLNKKKLFDNKTIKKIGENGRILLKDPVRFDRVEHIDDCKEINIFREKYSKRVLQSIK